MKRDTSINIKRVRATLIIIESKAFSSSLCNTVWYAERTDNKGFATV